jgi:hypothetical protein
MDARKAADEKKDTESDESKFMMREENRALEK